MNLRQEPVNVAVWLHVIGQDAQLLIQWNIRPAQSQREAHPPLVKAVAVPFVPYKTQPPRSRRNDVGGNLNGTGHIFHGNQVAVHGCDVGIDIGVHQNDGKPKITQHIQIAPVKQLNAEKARSLLHRQMGRETPRQEFLWGHLIHHQRVPGAAETLGKCRDEERTEMVVRRHMAGKQGDIFAACHWLDACGGRFGYLVIPQLLCLLQHRVLGCLWHGSSAVEDFRHRISGQAAGIGNVLHGNPFVCHIVCLLCPYIFECIIAQQNCKINFTKCKILRR